MGTDVCVKCGSSWSSHFGTINRGHDPVLPVHEAELELLETTFGGRTEADGIGLRCTCGWTRRLTDYDLPAVRHAFEVHKAEVLS